MTKIKQTQIGKIPEDWEVVKLSDIGEILTGTTPSTKVKEYWGKGYQFVTPTDFSESKYVHTTERYVTQKGAKKARLIPKDSVMVTCIASVGEVSMALKECITNQQINTIVCDKEINPHYVYYVMVVRKKILKRWAGITTSPIIKKSLFEKFLIPLPPFPEQKGIVQILSIVDEAIQKSYEIITKTEKLKKGLMQELLTKGVINGFMFDTTVFGNILDKKIDINKFPKKFDYYITHIQPDELNKIKDKERKKKLFRFFKEIIREELPTENFVLNYSKLGKARLGNGKILEELRKGNLKHTEDSLIGETAIKQGLILITNDRTLLNRVKALNGQAISIEQFLRGKYKEFKETELGKIPKDWEVVELKDIGVFQYGYTTSSKEENTGIKFLRITDIKDDGIVAWSDVPYCELDSKNYGKYELHEGDILFARIGATSGKTCYIDHKVKGIFASYLIRFQPKINVHTKFIYYYTQSNIYWFQAFRKREGQLKKGMNANTLSQLKIPLPPLLEQQRIASILTKIDKKLELERKRKEKFKRIKKGLMNDLLTGNKRIKFRG